MSGETSPNPPEPHPPEPLPPAIAITGASGQLGSIVLRKLARDPSVRRIVALDLRPPIVASDKIQFVRADVRDPEIGRHLQGIDALIHLAFIVTTKIAPAEFESINVGGSLNVFGAAEKAGVRQILYSSSVAAYGVVPGHPVPITEDAPRREQPSFPYSYAKHRVEAFLDGFERAHPEILVVRLRPTILIGTRIVNPLARLFGWGLDRGLLFAADDTPSPLVWDEDVAEAGVLALRRRARGAFNVSADDSLPARELAARTGLRVMIPPASLLAAGDLLAPISKRLGLGDPVDPSWRRSARGVLLLPTSERAIRELGWRRLAPTAADVIRRYREQANGLTDGRLAAGMRQLEEERPAIDALRGVHADVHLQVTGPGGGDWALRADGDRLHTKRGIPAPPTSVVMLSLPTWRDLTSGRLDFAAARSDGRVEVEGAAAGETVARAAVSQLTGSGEKGPRRLRHRLTRWIG